MCSKKANENVLWALSFAMSYDYRIWHHDPCLSVYLICSGRWFSIYQRNLELRNFSCDFTMEYYNDN